MSTSPEKRPYVIDFANRSFRDTADQDYISARGAHRAGLVQPFLWSSLQAIEKYLKAILLYNDYSAKKLRHHLEKAFRRVESISDLHFVVDADVQEFIAYLNLYAQDRYLSHPVFLKANSVLMLDKTVWQIRRFCFYMRGGSTPANGTEVDWLPLNIRSVMAPQYDTHPERYRILGGYLEKVIKTRGPAYETLTWKNFFYGRRKKRQVRDFIFRTSESYPTHSQHPEVFPDLEKLVEFPKHVRDHYSNIAQTKTST